MTIKPNAAYFPFCDNNTNRKYWLSLSANTVWFRKRFSNGVKIDQLTMLNSLLLYIDVVLVVGCSSIDELSLIDTDDRYWCTLVYSDKYE